MRVCARRCLRGIVSIGERASERGGRATDRAVWVALDRVDGRERARRGLAGMGARGCFVCLCVVEMCVEVPGGELRLPGWVTLCLCLCVCGARG